MDWSQQCVAVIPCFNEARHIAGVLSGVRRQLPHVIVVDDGSWDATAEIAQLAGAEVLRLKSNLGKGAALRAGLDRAREGGFIWALMLDGDGQHAPGDFPHFFNRAEVTGASLIVGNRMNDVAAMPWLRRFVNRWMSRRLSRFTGTPLADSQCGFRLMNLDAYSCVSLTTDRFEVESEMLVAFLSARCRVEFVPVRAIYKSEASSIHPLLDSWRWFSWWWKSSRCDNSARAERTARVCDEAGATRSVAPLPPSQSYGATSHAALVLAAREPLPSPLQPAAAPHF